MKSSVEVHAAFFRVKEVAMALANKSLMQFWLPAVLQYQTHALQRNISGNVQIEEVTDYAIRVEDLSIVEAFGCNDELVEYFTDFFNLVQTQSDTRLNIKEVVSFRLITKKGRYLQHHIYGKSTIWKKQQSRLLP